MDNKVKRCCSISEKLSNADDIASPNKNKSDFLFRFSITIIILAISIHLLLPDAPIYIHHFAHTILDIISDMWWGITLGIIFVGLMDKLPREYFIALLGKDNNFSGLIRAVFGGLFLDLCCHGILLMAAKLYERGVSLPQVITFLVASPWNSVSLTLILISLIGIKWTAIYVLGSLIIALLTGIIFQILVKFEVIQQNPNALILPDDYNLGKQTIFHLKNVNFSKQNIISVFKSGWLGGKMIIKWLLFGTIIAAASRTFIPHEIFSELFGPTMLGLFLTVLVATLIEICSEGSSPIASEFVTQANAPGNGFSFLMAGVATDYTEILAVKEFTGSWKISLLLPLITIPQIIFLSWLMNVAAN